MEKFRSVLTEQDLIDGDTITAIENQFVKLGEYQVQAGEEIAIGFGGHSSQEDAVGRFFAVIKDDDDPAALEKGILRLTVYSPQDRPLKVLHEVHTSISSQGANDRTLQVPLPENPINLREDQKLVLEFKSLADDTIVKADCEILLDVTTYVV